MFHRIWLGGPVPDRVAELGETFRRLHPSWTLRTWTDTNMPPLRNQSLYDAATSFAMRADIARYELVLRHGGVYIDADFEALRPLDDLVAELGCFASLEDRRWIANGILGARPGHPFLRRLVELLPDSAAEYPGAPPNVVSGPQFFTRTFMASSPALQASVGLFPAPVLLPYHFSEPERAGGPFPDAFAVHHWDQGW